MLRLCYGKLRMYEVCGLSHRNYTILSQYFINRLISNEQRLIQKYPAFTDVKYESGQKPNSKKAQPTKIQKEIEDYFNSKECLKEVLPRIYGKYVKKRFKYPDGQFVVDRDIAIAMVDAIKPDLLKDDSHIFELNPGPGVLTEQLLLNNIKNLTIFENDVQHISYLNKLVALHKKNIKVVAFNFVHLGSVIYQDTFDNGSRLDKIMENVKRKKWSDSPAFKLIGVLPPSLSGRGNFLKYLMYSIIFNNKLMSYGRPELYVIIHPTKYMQLTSNSDAGYLLYRSSSVIFSLLFDHQIIMKIPRNSVFPWLANYVAKKQAKLSKAYSVDEDKLYFVRMTPREDLFSIIRPDLMKPFWYFLRHHMMSRKNRVIPMMEKWIPGCGPRLIAEGISVFTEFGDLSPQQLLSIFNNFTSWPEFNSCPFLASMETALLKMSTADGDSLDNDDVEVENEDKKEEVILLPKKN